MWHSSHYQFQHWGWYNWFMSMRKYNIKKPGVLIRQCSKWRCPPRDSFQQLEKKHFHSFSKLRVCIFIFVGHVYFPCYFRLVLFVPTLFVWVFPKTRDVQGVFRSARTSSTTSDWPVHPSARPSEVSSNQTNGPMGSQTRPDQTLRPWDAETLRPWDPETPKPTPWPPGTL